MRYDEKFKLKCVKMYYEGKYPPTPKGIGEKPFHDMIREWVHMYEVHGADRLKHGENRKWSPEEKLRLVSEVNAGASARSVAVREGMNFRLLCNWVQKYRIEGYSGLVNKPKGRPPKEPQMPKKQNVQPAELNKSEREELIRLRAENEYLRTENAYIKKLTALRRERWAAELKAKRQQQSGNSEKKDAD